MNNIYYEGTLLEMAICMKTYTKKEADDIVLDEGLNVTNFCECCDHYIYHSKYDKKEFDEIVIVPHEELVNVDIKLGLKRR